MSTNDYQKLRECPFCGWEAKLHRVFISKAAFVSCKNCESTSPLTTEAEAIKTWNTRHEKTCDGCRHLATSMRVDYHIDPCCECVRNAPDLYEPKEDTDAD
ncbi:MAG: Lar family restriction alleviation protein [Eggerthellaceae bacterium]|nr:Lar family restriction alleviation protein [Eggerthellaceae bacterium]